MYSKEQIKSHGATFTPKGLSDFLANRIIKYLNNPSQVVLDPACGTGEITIIHMGKN